MEYSAIIRKAFVRSTTALSHIFHTRKKLDFFALLPNEIVADILYRLPADTVVDCKRVCKNWHHIFTSQHFAKTHLKKAKNAVNLSVFKQCGKRHFFVMERGTKGIIRLEKVDIINPSFNSSVFLLRVVESFNGLLLFECHSVSARGPLFTISNPITREEAPFLPPEEGDMDDFFMKLAKEQRNIFGFFYDQVMGEYKLLLFFKYDWNVTYYVYGWRSKSEKTLCTNMFFPKRQYDNTTVVVDRLVCWKVVNEFNGIYVSHCSECVMIFKMDDETLHCVPHPETMNCEWRPYAVNPHENMRLLNLDGDLGLAFSFATIITIWSLQDSVNFSWVVRHVIDFGLELEKYPVVPSRPPYDEFLTAEVLNIVDGELIFLLRSKGLFSRNLQSKTVNKLTIDVKITGSLSLEISSVSHVKSLISPEEAFPI